MASEELTPTLAHARKLWEFLIEGRRHEPGELLILCCSYDLRVCDYACDLIKKGIAPRLLITGGSGAWTSHLWTRSEASVFAERARNNGLAEHQILLEEKAGNFAENISFSRALCPQAQRVTFLTKPNSIRRVYQTLPVQWPGLTAHVDAPLFRFPWEASNIVGLFGLIDEMVGDIHRLQVYPQLGYQVPIKLPEDVLVAWRLLIEAGFNRHLLNPPPQNRT